MKMKHSLLALAVGAASSAAVVTPAAAGDVTVYGRAQVEVAAVSWQEEASEVTPGACDGDNVSVADGCDGIDVTDNAMGRVGFKASEDLGNGMKGLAKFEFKADTADGDSSGNVSLTKRETLVGLNAGWGQLELGRLKSAYKYYGGVKYDPFVATTLQARGNGGMSGQGAYGNSTGLNGIQGGLNAYGHNSFLSDQIGYQYTSGPIKFRVTYGIQDGLGDYSLGLMYKAEKFEVFGAATGTGDKYSDGNNAADDLKEFTSYKVGGAFKAGAHKFVLQYEGHDVSWENTTTNKDISPTHIFAGWNMKMGKNTFVVQGGMFDSDTDAPPGGNNADATYAALGIIHKFSKMTRVFGGYRMSDVDDKSSADVISVGLRKDF